LERIDPNQVPSSMEQKQINHLKHPKGKLGILKYDRLSFVLEPTSNDRPLQTFKGKWTGDPDRVAIIPEKFLNRDQPFVGTCSKPVAGQNMGCYAHNGCPYPDAEDPRGRGPGPFNVIIEKDGQKSPCVCHDAYHGVRRGLPTSQVHYLYNGWRIDTEGTTTSSVKAKKTTDEWGSQIYEDVEIHEEVPNLGPMYAEHFGKRRQKPKPEKPLEGREDMGSGTGPVEFDGVSRAVNAKAGNLSTAPRPAVAQEVKIK
jgi:hypothetical protein